jgi:hypothetical protein
VDKEEQWKIVEVMVNFISVGFIESFRAKFCEKLKAKEPIKYEQIRQDLWKKPWWFCQETIWKHKVCGGISRYTQNSHKQP